MSIQLQPSVPLVTLVKIEPPTVIENERPESEIVEIGIDDILDSSESEEEIIPDVKDIDIVYHPVCENPIKSVILESKHRESVETRVLINSENSPFIKTENITQRNKSEDTSDGNVSRSTGHGVVEVQGSNEYSNVLSNLEADAQLVPNCSKDLNSIGIRTRTTSWEENKDKIKIIKAPMIPVEAHEYHSLAQDRHICNHCQQVYKRVHNLKFHIRKIHREITTMYQCPYCLYKSRWGVKAHIIIKHKDTKDIQWFQCDLCEMKFKLKYQLNRHMKCHFTHEDGLDLKSVEAHEYTSLTKDKYVCNHCQHTYNALSSLKRHIKQMHRKVTTNIPVSL